MKENRYLISDAAKHLEIEPHVLRYWEEELDLTIHRNEMGHRYYTEADMTALKNVRDLKSQGFQLKAIKLLVPDLYGNEPFDLNKMVKLKDELNAKVETSEALTVQKHNQILSNEDKLAQFQNIINQAVAKALIDNQNTLGETVGARMSEEVSEKVSDRVLKQMDYLMRETDEHAEARFRKLDETIREVQKARMEVAAGKAGTRQKKGLFKKRKPKKHSA